MPWAVPASSDFRLQINSSCAITLPIVAEHGALAAKRLKALGYNNIQEKGGDGYQGWLEHAPFAAIMVTAGAESIPLPLLEQLKE